MTFLIGASFPLTALVPFIHVVPAPAESCSWDCFCSSRAPERNEAQSCWLRSQRGWQMRGNFIWARAANSGPNKLWITLCWVRLHKNSESFICWKTPRRTHRCLLHPYGREPEKHKMGQKRLGPSSCPPPSNTPVAFQHPGWWALQSMSRHWAPPPAERWNQWVPQGESSLILTAISFTKLAETLVQASCECWIRPVCGLLTQENTVMPSRTYFHCHLSPWISWIRG